MPAVDALAACVGRALRARAARLAFAESCTGGLLGSRVTGVPGSSRYLLGGVVAYHNSAKIGLLRVPRRMLARFGAVSAPVAAAMARGARSVFGAELAVAVTGVAGPGGGSAGKPVGLVYVAVCGFGRARCRRALFTGDRQRVRDQAADLALIMLLEHLVEIGMPCGGSMHGALRCFQDHGASTRQTPGRPGAPGGAPGGRRLFPGGSNCSILTATNLPVIPRQGR